MSTSFYSALRSLINNRSDQYGSVGDSIQTIYIILWKIKLIKYEMLFIKIIEYYFLKFLFEMYEIIVMKLFIC